MSGPFQTVVALVIVALAALYLFRHALAKRKHPGCGSDCGAVSPEVKRLQRHLRDHRG